MAYQTGSVQAYRQTRVKTASQGRVIVMLYDEAIRQIDEAVQLMQGENRQLDRINNAIVKAQAIVTELMVSLDMTQGGDIAGNLLRLYLFFNAQLMDGNVRKETKPLTEVRGMLAELRGAWKQIENETSGGKPVSDSTTGLNIAG